MNLPRRVRRCCPRSPARAIPATTLTSISSRPQRPLAASSVPANSLPGHQWRRQSRHCSRTTNRRRNGVGHGESCRRRCACGRLLPPGAAEHFCGEYGGHHCLDQPGHRRGPHQFPGRAHRVARLCGQFRRCGGEPDHRQPVGGQQHSEQNPRTHADRQICAGYRGGNPGFCGDVRHRP